MQARRHGGVCGKTDEPPSGRPVDQADAIYHAPPNPERAIARSRIVKSSRINHHKVRLTERRLLSGKTPSRYSDRPYRDRPSTMVWYRPVSRLARRSTRPEGQTISTSADFVSAGSQTSSLGSQVERYDRPDFTIRN